MPPRESRLVDVVPLPWPEFDHKLPISAPELAMPQLERRTTRSQTELHKTRILDLPTELMQLTFIFYYNITEAPILLLLICHRWRAIALSVSSLWSTIRFEPGRINQSTPSIERTMHCPIMCLSWSQLEFAARRAGTGMARFICQLAWMEPNTEAHHWMSETCRSLRIQQDYIPASAFADSFRNLANLEELFLDNTTFYASLGLKRFVIDLVVRSPRLTVLEITGLFPDDIFEHPALLGRLQKLAIRTSPTSGTQIDQDGSFRLLKNLKELDWPFDTPPGLRHIASNLRTLSIEACTTFPTIHFPGLASLTLRCTTEFHADSESLSFPFLTRLTFDGPWKWLAKLNAPRLHSLNIDCWDLWKSNHPLPPALMQQARVRPISLTFSSRMSERNLIKLLAREWSDINELHREYQPFDTVFLGPVLLKALTGAKNGDYICPRLRCFTMKTLNPAHSAKSAKSGVEAQLRRIIHVRQERGDVLHSVGLLWDEFEEERATGIPSRELGEYWMTIL